MLKTHGETMRTKYIDFDELKLFYFQQKVENRREGFVFLQHFYLEDPSHLMYPYSECMFSHCHQHQHQPNEIQPKLSNGNWGQTLCGVTATDCDTKEEKS